MTPTHAWDTVKACELNCMTLCVHPVSPVHPYSRPLPVPPPVPPPVPLPVPPPAPLPTAHHTLRLTLCAAVPLCCALGSAVIFSTGLEDGAAAEEPLRFPRIFDIYAIVHESTGAVKTFFVCCGLASPVLLKKSMLAVDKGFVLGLEFTIVAAGRAASCERNVEFRAKGKAIDPNKEPPIVAHALGDTKLRIRPMDSIMDLNRIIGAKAIGSLRALLLRSELYRVVVKDMELVQSPNVLNFLQKFPEGVNTRTQQGKLGESVLMQGLGTTVKGLEAARAEQSRMYTLEKQTRALQTFVKTAQEIVQLAGNLHQSLHLSSPFNETASQKLLAKLMKMEPKLGVSAPKAGAAGAPKGGPKGGAGADRKRNEPDVASGNSPADGKGARVIDRSLTNPRLGALLGGSVSSDSSSGSPAGGLMTPLGLAQIESNSSKVIELGGKLQAAEQTLMQVRAELAEEKRTSARLQGELKSAQGQITALGTAESTIAGLRAELKVKDESLKDLRHSQALWSSMFMAKTSVEPDSFERLMRAQKGDGGGSSSSQ